MDFLLAAVLVVRGRLSASPRGLLVFSAVVCVLNVAWMAAQFWYFLQRGSRY